MVLESEGKEEGVWTIVTEDGKKLKGKTIGKTVSIKEVEEGDEIEFSKENIFHTATAERTQKIVEDYKKEGIIPGVFNSGFGGVRRNIEGWLKLESPWVKLKKGDKNFFLKNMEALESESAEGERIEGIYRLFLSLIFMIVTPQIVRNFNNGIDIEESQKEDLRKLLQKSSNIFKEITETHYFLLEQMRSFHSSSDIEELRSEDLGWYFSKLLDISSEALR